MLGGNAFRDRNGIRVLKPERRKPADAIQVGEATSDVREHAPRIHGE